MDSVENFPQGLEADEHRRLWRALSLLTLVLAFGTFGFMIIEPGWSLWKSLYFTLITVTTVGYGDEGISEQGRAFTTVLLIVGIATATYAFGQVVQAAVSYQNNWRHRMQKSIDHLHDHYIICGLGRVGRTVCEHLLEASTPFVVIEPDPDRFQKACSAGFLAIHGSATEDGELLRAGIERARGIVCAANSDSANIVITLSARELNPRIQIVSRAGDEHAVHKIRRAGATHVVTPSLRGGIDIANLLVRPHLAEFLQQSRRTDSGYQLVEVTVGEDSEIAGQTLRQYGSVERSLAFVALKRNSGDTIIRPDADETFQPGETVIVVGTNDAVSRMSEHAMARCLPV